MASKDGDKSALTKNPLHSKALMRRRAAANPLLLRKHGADFVFFCGHLKFYSTCRHIHVSKKTSFFLFNPFFKVIKNEVVYFKAELLQPSRFSFC